MKKKKETWECVLCGTAYTDTNNLASEYASTCMWIHIFRKDKYYKSLKLK